MPSRKLFDITVQRLHSTEKAVKYTDGDTEFWVPKSAMLNDGDIQVEENKDGTYILTAPEWWLKEKGLI